MQLTILNAMAGRDIVAALDQHVAWGLPVLDLKDSIFGKGIADLADEEAARLAELASERGLSAYCLSTGLFLADIEQGEETFRAHLERLPRLLAIARLLRPRFIRLLAARSSRRADFADSAAYVRERHPWLLDRYREAIDRISAAGFEATIENEVHDCLFAHPDEILAFFQALDRPGQVCLTWDIQNLWQEGTFPSREVYRRLQPLIGYCHLKGGQTDGDSPALRWRSALEDASWPVAEIVREVVADGVSPVICLNPPHGAPRPGDDAGGVTQRDLAFVRRILG